MLGCEDKRVASWKDSSVRHGMSCRWSQRTELRQAGKSYRLAASCRDAQSLVVEATSADSLPERAARPWGPVPTGSTTTQCSAARSGLRVSKGKRRSSGSRAMTLQAGIKPISPSYVDLWPVTAEAFFGTHKLCQANDSAVINTALSPRRNSRLPSLKRH